MKPINEIKATIEKRPARSAWSKGVKVYALELLEQFEENAQYYRKNGKEPPELNMTSLLNGAEDWNAYSCGGSSLIYDCDIAKRLCCPSELKRCRYGERRPNSREEWLDVQARALYQASRLIICIATQSDKRSLQFKGGSKTERPYGRRQTANDLYRRRQPLPPHHPQQAAGSGKVRKLGL